MQSRDWEELDLAEECIEISAFARRIQTCLIAYECGIPFVFFLKAIFAFIWFQPIDLYCAWISWLMIQQFTSPANSLTPTGIKEELCKKSAIAYIIACAKIGIIPLAGIFCYLNSCHFYFTEIETFIDTWTIDLASANALQGNWRLVRLKSLELRRVY